jgi:hypothetical protein
MIFALLRVSDVEENTMQHTAHAHLSNERHHRPSLSLLQGALWVGWIAVGLNAWLISQF